MWRAEYEARHAHDVVISSITESSPRSVAPRDLVPTTESDDVANDGDAENEESKPESDDVDVENNDATPNGLGDEDEEMTSIGLEESSDGEDSDGES